LLFAGLIGITSAFAGPKWDLWIANSLTGKPVAVSFISGDCWYVSADLLNGTLVVPNNGVYTQIATEEINSSGTCYNKTDKYVELQIGNQRVKLESLYGTSVFGISTPRTIRQVFINPTTGSYPVEERDIAMTEGTRYGGDVTGVSMLMWSNGELELDPRAKWK
jgi:hypothetical protein